MKNYLVLAQADGTWSVIKQSTIKSGMSQDGANALADYLESKTRKSNEEL